MVKAATVRSRAAQETPAAKRRRAGAVYAALASEYPDARCELDYRNPYELLVATILSAQCTDKRVNLVTPALFTRYPTAEALANADPAALEQLIRSTGFFRAKTRNLLGAARAMVDRHGSSVPPSMDALVHLPGVGRKTANVVLGNAFGIESGVVVDTHIGRLSRRLGFTSAADPVRIERDLMPLFARERWTMLAHLLIWHGRRVCAARMPRCGACVIARRCPSRRVTR